MTRIFLAGDVMPGRGIDQILHDPGDPRLHESYVKSAQDYVRLAERTNGPIPRDVGLDYVWGEAAAALRQARPDWGLVNLETAITDDGSPAPKGINYRMSVRNAQGLAALGFDCVSLANNHVLDWGQEGLVETLDTLQAMKLPYAGAGRDADEAMKPAILTRGSGARILVFGFACHDSGVPWSWQAGAEQPGVNLLTALGAQTVSSIHTQVARVKEPGDIAIASIHWGGNWGYDIPPSHSAFAKDLIDEAAIDLVHGHSSHHAKGWELHRGKLILYGCGDFLNDYEGITGEERYRSDLTAMYLADIDGADGRLSGLTVVPFQIRKFSLKRAPSADIRWFRNMLNRECQLAGPEFVLTSEEILQLQGI